MINDKFVLTATGFGGTGSSAVSDIMKEHESVKSFGNDECWLFQDLYGIRDLEYFLTVGNHRSKTPFAIDQFEKMIRNNVTNFSKIFGDEFYSKTMKYIDELQVIKFHKSYSDFEISGKYRTILFRDILPYIQNIWIKQRELDHREPWIPRKEKKYSYLEQSDFQVITKKYFKSLIKDLLISQNYLYIDQLVPATEISSYNNYFDNLRVVIVDRDPRDLYLLNQIKWRNAAYICDTRNVWEYISWYRSLRKKLSDQELQENVLVIKFEDLVYKYNSTVHKLYDHFKIYANCKNERYRYFNPEESLANVKLWQRNTKYDSEIKLITKELAEYLYI